MFGTNPVLYLRRDATQGKCIVTRLEWIHLFTNKYTLKQTDLRITELHPLINSFFFVTSNFFFITLILSSFSCVRSRTYAYLHFHLNELKLLGNKFFLLLLLLRLSFKPFSFAVVIDILFDRYHAKVNFIF